MQTAFTAILVLGLLFFPATVVDPTLSTSRVGTGPILLQQHARYRLHKRFFASRCLVESAATAAAVLTHKPKTELKFVLSPLR
jgi:hypothetical protein